MLTFGGFLRNFSVVDVWTGSSRYECQYILNNENKISSYLQSYSPEAKNVKTDYSSMTGCLLQQLIDHNFGWQVTTLLTIIILC